MDEAISRDIAITSLAGLSSMGPKRLDQVIASSDPVKVFDDVMTGRIEVDGVDQELRARWRRELTLVSPSDIRVSLAAGAVKVCVSGDASFPKSLSTDIDPCPVLFCRGRCLSSRSPVVAIVGTRRASGVGREVARELGYGLSEAGVCVVSGLALGIDGAAHAGALAADGAPPVAFVGGGPDVVYPARHRDLWAQMVLAGSIASEAPPGAPPVRWRFPARNRLIAAFADIVVVVESRRSGGSLLTVDEAIRRDRTVMAVPGSVRNPASEGANQLIADGCTPVLGVDDVLLALGLSMAEHPERSEATPVPAHLQPVFEALDDGPSSIDEIGHRCDHALLDVLSAVGELVALGLAIEDGARVRRA